MEESCKIVVILTILKLNKNALILKIDLMKEK